MRNERLFAKKLLVLFLFVTIIFVCFQGTEINLGEKTKIGFDMKPYFYEFKFERTEANSAQNSNTTITHQNTEETYCLVVYENNGTKEKCDVKKPDPDESGVHYYILTNTLSDYLDYISLELECGSTHVYENKTVFDSPFHVLENWKAYLYRGERELGIRRLRASWGYYGNEHECKLVVWNLRRI